MFKRNFQNGDRIILLRGALVKSDFDGLEAKNFDFRDVPISGFVTNPWEPFCLTLALQKYFKKNKKNTNASLVNALFRNYKKTEILFWGKTRA